ncbi:MAG: hypothetical protein NVS4B11_21320 [Ktedonobacteraceae bacterium]
MLGVTVGVVPAVTLGLGVIPGVTLGVMPGVTVAVVLSKALKRGLMLAVEDRMVMVLDG